MPEAPFYCFRGTSRLRSTAMSSQHPHSEKSVYQYAFVIGSGFFTVALIEPMYSAYVPLMLADFLDSSASIGGILSALTLIAPLIIPVFATLSDRTRTRIGKRMPYIVSFLPLAAVSLAAVPVAAHFSLAWLVAALAVTNLFRHAARGPVVSLMPDLIPSHQRSQANGVINTMGGLASLTATGFLAPLIVYSVAIPGVGRVPRALPFFVTAVLIVASTIFVFTKVREPRSASDAASRRKRKSLLPELMAVARRGRSGPFPVLAAVMLWFLGWRLVTPFVTTYARVTLGAGEGIAGLTFGMIAVSQTSFAIAGGIIAARFGRRRIMSWALAGLSVLGVAAFVNDIFASHSGYPALPLFWLLLIGLGIGWVTLITNGLPVVWDHGSDDDIGLHTGLYYFVAQISLVAGPGIGGTIIDVAGFSGLFLTFSSVMIAAFSMLRLQRKALSLNSAGDPT